MRSAFPSLATDATDINGANSADSWRASTRKSIAIATPYVFGNAFHNGIGTACHSLAECLASAGHSVTMLLSEAEPRHRGPRFAHWQEVYRRQGIRVVSVPEPALRIEGPILTRRSYAVYAYLRNEAFDLVHFPEVLGLGYYSILAKRLGLAFARTFFCVTVNGPSLWHRGANREAPHAGDIAADYLERKSTEMADVVVAPSQHILRWAVSQGWKLPPRTFVEQYLLPETARKQREACPRPIDELVFFGRVETRKGIELFFAALARLSAERRNSVGITLLGTYGAVGGRHAADYLCRLADHGQMKWKGIHEADSEQALAYLRNRNALVVIPSLEESLGFTAMECLAARIPFIASRIPAFSELLAPKDHDRILFDANPAALATKLEEVLGRGPPAPARFAVAPSRTSENWERWHRALPPAPRRRASKKPSTRISVCVTHRERPAFLEQCLRSIRAQTLAPFEVIVVDDGSRSRLARDFLATLRAHEGIRVIRLKTRRGPVAARNLAARSARGEFLFFMDDDNVAKPEELETLAQVAEKTGADIVTCAFDRFRGMAYPGRKTPVSGRWVPVGDSIGYGAINSVLGDMNSLVRRQVFRELGGLRGRKNAGEEDAEFFLRAVVKGYRLFAVPDALFWYRMHRGNWSRTLVPSLGKKHRLSALPKADSRHRDSVRKALEPHRAAGRSGIPSEKQWVRRYQKQALRAVAKRPELFDQSTSFSRSLYSASARPHFAKWRGRGGISVASQASRARIEMSKPAGAVLLPKIALPANKRLLLTIEVTALFHGVLKIEGDLLKRPLWVENGASFGPGHQTLRIVLDAATYRGRLRIRPSHVHETLLIRRLDIQAED